MRLKELVLSLAIVFIAFSAWAQYGDYEVRVEVSGNGFAHFTTIYFDDESWDPQAVPSYGWDPCCDALLILGNPNQPQVFTEVVAPPEPVNSSRLSINGLPHLFEETHVPLGFLPGTLAPYVFTFKNTYTLPPGTLVELEDLSLNITQDLVADSTYDTWGAPSDDEGRFLVKFFPSSVTNVDDKKGIGSSVQIISKRDAITVLGVEVNSKYNFQIISLSGQVVYEQTLTGAVTYRVNTSWLPLGMFVVALSNKEGYRKMVKLVLD